MKDDRTIALTLYHFPQFPLDSGKEFVGRGTGVVGCETGILPVGVGMLRAPPGGLAAVIGCTQRQVRKKHTPETNESLTEITQVRT